MYIINFSDISGQSWGVEEVLNRCVGTSTTLDTLADKINYMILKGRANDVKPMIERIYSKGIKNLIQPNHSEEKWVLRPDGVNDKLKNLGNIGKGHFRWNYQAYILNNVEINHLKKYFKL